MTTETDSVKGLTTDQEMDYGKRRILHGKMVLTCMKDSSGQPDSDVVMSSPNSIRSSSGKSMFASNLRQH